MGKKVELWFTVLQCQTLNCLNAFWPCAKLNVSAFPRWKWSHMYWMTSCVMSVRGTRCGGKFAPFFCANVTCLQYYCEYCWAAIHSRAGREFHKPLVKEGGDRPRHISFRWNWSGAQGCAIHIHALFISLSPFYLEFFFKSEIVFILKFLSCCFFFFFAEENAIRKWL